MAAINQKPSPLLPKRVVALFRVQHCSSNLMSTCDSSIKSDIHELATQAGEEEALPKGGCTLFKESLKGSDSVRLGASRFICRGFLSSYSGF